MTDDPNDAIPANTELKVLLAVHGIGDQVACETIQSVALRVAAYHGSPVATPLGRFYTQAAVQCSSEDPPFPQRMDSGDPRPLQTYILGEAYWASIPRRVAKERYILEETKRWGRSIAARVAYRGRDSGWAAGTLNRIVVVLDEIVETIGVLERLTFIAAKAGVFKFNLKKLLVDFVDDVQLVADFGMYRTQILKTFDNAVTDALRQVGQDERASVYIVAHSEGSVIAFLALIEALRAPEKYAWIRQIRGVMTIGSPIEVHHLLWPQLWQVKADGTGDQPGPAAGAIREAIEWHNYMDYGDPIAYELESTQEWLRERGFDEYLRLSSHAFSRYPLPGKAHVDYWTDDEIFGHFLRKVVEKSAPSAGSQKWFQKWTRRLADRKRKAVSMMTLASGEIPSRLWVPALTLFLPYALVLMLLGVGVYTLEHATAGAFGHAFSVGRIARDVLGFGALLFGVTAASRLPRLADKSRWNVAAWGILALSMLIFFRAWSAETRAQVASAVGPLTIGGVSLSPAVFVCGLAAAVVLLAGIAIRVFPVRGHYVLPVLGLAAALSIVVPVVISRGVNQDAPAAWPVVFGALMFFYLWWLSALLFDLTFVWRRYARHSAVREHLATLPRVVDGVAQQVH